MKKLVATVAALAFAASLTACGQAGEKAAEETAEGAADATAEAAADATAEAGAATEEAGKDMQKAVE